MDKKQLSSDEASPVSDEIKKLESRIKANHIAAVIIQIIAVGIAALAVLGLVKAGVGVFCGVLVFAVLAEVFVYSLLKENKGIKIRIEAARRRPVRTVNLADPLYKNKGYTFSVARELYCRQIGKKESELSKEDESVIWQYSYDDFAYLLMWIIENNLYQPSKDLDENDAQEAKEYAAQIKRREKLPTDYLESYEGYFMEDSIKKKARAFVIEYYKGPYEDEVRKFAKEKLNSELYGFPFRWEDYNAFKVYIDEAYSEYQRKITDKA